MVKLLSALNSFNKTVICIHLSAVFLSLHISSILSVGKLTLIFHVSSPLFFKNNRLFYIGEEEMKKFLFILVLLIWVSHSFNEYQMRNANNVDTNRMQRYVEYINATNQLNSYNRR